MSRRFLAYGIIVLWAAIFPFLIVKRHDVNGWIAQVLTSLWISVSLDLVGRA